MERLAIENKYVIPMKPSVLQSPSKLPPIGNKDLITALRA